MPADRRRRGALLALLFCAAIAFMPGARAAESLEVSTVGGPSALLWPIFIGLAKGQFAAQELTIDLLFAPSSAALQQQVAAGSLKIADGGLIDPVRAIIQGAPLAVVRIEGQAPPYALLGQPAIKSIADLRGKTIMVGGAKDITRTYLERMLAPSGIKDGQYDLVYAGATAARFAALQSGAVAAAILFPPFNFHAEAAGYTNLGLVVDYAKNLPFSGFAVNRPWADQHRQTVQKFLAAYNGAVAWFDQRANREEAIKILVDASKQEPSDIEKSYDFFHKINFFEPSGKVSKKKVEEIVTILKATDDIDKPIALDTLFLAGVTEVTE